LRKEEGGLRKEADGGRKKDVIPRSETTRDLL